MAPAPAAAPDLDRETFQTAFKFAPIGMAFLSLSGRWLRANRALLEILGLAEPDLLATTMEALLHPDDVEPVARYLQNIRDGAILGYQMEVRYRHPRGNPVWVTQSAALIPDEDGNPTSLIVQIQNITLRKRAEDAIRRALEFNQTILNCIHESISIVNVKDLTIAGANRVFLAAAGLSLEEVVGKKCYEISHHRNAPCSPPDDSCPIEDLMKTGSYASHEHKHFLGDGSVSFAEVSVSPIKDEKGETVQVVHLARDITLRKRAEEDLRQSEERFRAIFDNSNDGILLADMENKRFFIGNDRICQMLGYSPDEIKGMGVMDIHPPADLPYVVDQFEKQARREIAVSKDLPVKRKDGRVFYADVNSYPITLAGKTYLVGAFSDTTLRRQAEEERERLIAELQEALAKVKTLSGLLPICASCKKIRDDKGYWNQIEVYIGDRAEVDFSHGICPDCAKKLYPDIYEKMMRQKENEL